MQSRYFVVITLATIVILIVYYFMSVCIWNIWALHDVLCSMYVCSMYNVDVNILIMIFYVSHRGVSNNFLQRNGRVHDGELCYKYM